jgi:large subunit ribosomal protein L1
VTLPHGTGKKLNIVVADDAVIEAVSNGKINFDVLIATPDMMPKLAKVARVLGPRGLMPNPKNGTVTPKPEEAIAKLSAGQITYKTEPQSPIVHTSVGKLSFDNNKLEENINTFINSIGAAKIKSATLKSTMSPGIKISC